VLRNNVLDITDVLGEDLLELVLVPTMRNSNVESLAAQSPRDLGGCDRTRFRVAASGETNEYDRDATKQPHG
jgi:hypothetical protein